MIFVAIFQSKRMRKSKLIELLRTFSGREMQDFRDFVASPYFNRKEELRSMLDLLSVHAPDFSSAGLRKKKFYAGLFPRQAYDDKHLRYLMSDLLKLAEHFLIISRYEAGEEQRQLDLMQCFLERKLEKHYRQQSRKTKKSLSSRKKTDVALFYQQLTFSDLGEQKFSQKRIRQYDPNIQYASESLDRFYFLKKLKYTCGMLDRQSILQGEYQADFSEALARHLLERDFFGQPILRIYYTILQALREGDNDRHFQRLKSLIAGATEQITLADLREIYGFGINYCARKIRQGEEAYVAEALQLYREGIGREILVQDGVLSPWTFTNVVKLALRLRQYDWIEQFIRENAPKLPEAFRENALHYNLAELHYYTQAYEKAMDHLNQVRFSDLNYHLGARVMLAKIYYETREENALLSLLAAFTVFLKRNKKISNDLKKTYLNFCHFLFQLIRRKRQRLSKLREEIDQTELLTDRAWLLQTLEEEAGRAG